MNGSDPEAPLLDYFAELLHDEGDDSGEGVAVAAKEPAITKPSPHTAPKTRLADSRSRLDSAVSEPQPQPQRQAKPVVDLPQPQAGLAQLEALKRKQLQALLSHKLPEVAAAPVAPLQSVDPTPVQVKQALQPLTEPSLTVATEATVPVSETEQAFAQSINSVLAWGQNGRPEWAQQRFEALLFDVSGLTLAVPLIALGQIQAIGDNLTPIFGQSDWFMGLLQCPQGQIRTVNTALFVMPEKYSATFLETAKYVISIDSVPWGLAVDSVNQPISLDPTDVKWRSKRSTRPWLAGTVKSAMCALIDIPQMAAMLRDTEK